jgi:ribosomal protein L11 methylase PrmA
LFFFKFTANAVVRGVCEIRQALDHSERKEDRRIVAHVDPGIAPLDLIQSHATDRGAFGQYRNGYAPTTAGVAYVMTEFA